MKTSSVTNPIPLKFGDPFLLHASDGRYYMYGTSLGDGFEAFVSDDLIDWDSCGQVYKGGAPDQWNLDCFWAPEVYERGGRYYLFYSSNYRKNPTHEGENFKIGVAVSDSPAGPFKDLYDRPVFNPPYPIIDANVYFDDKTDKCYLYFSRCCYKHAVESEIADSLRKAGNFQEIEESWVYGVELKPDFSGTVGEPRVLFRASDSPWSRERDDQGNLTWNKVTDGPWLFRTATGRLGMLWTSWVFNDYTQGVAYSESGTLDGPWTQEPEPITPPNYGHSMLFQTFDGRWMRSVHSHRQDAQGRTVRTPHFFEVDLSGDKLKVKTP